MAYLLPHAVHNGLVKTAYLTRGFSEAEADAAVRLCEMTATCGIKTHNAIKALHLDDLFGSKVGGCVPNAEVEVIESRFDAVERWNANKKLGQAVAFDAMDRAMQLADQHGVGVVVVDDAFHYLWGGGYVIDAANKGYIAYTSCTASLAEVVPFGGKHPTLGTNPHSWGFPTQDLVGFPICIDWATSTVAMGRVQQFKREGLQLPPEAAVDEHGQVTQDPNQVKALLPFGRHKGYGLALLNELYGAYTGGSLPTIRSRIGQGEPGEKHTCQFFFQCIHPEAMACRFALGRSQDANVKAVIDDILGHGNQPPEGKAMLPGAIEAVHAAQTQKDGALRFTAAEIEAFEHLAQEVGFAWDASEVRSIDD